MDWRKTLQLVDAQLRHLAASGVGHLNLPPDPELAAALARLAAETAPPPPEPPAPAPAAPRPPASSSAGVTPIPRPPPAQPAATPPAAEALPASGSAAPPSPGGTAHASEFDSLPALHAGFRDCRRCGLAAGRTKLVFGVGHARPKLLFVGEGPGRDEDAQGLPFVGRAGALLTAGIQALGLTREDVYIANVVKCRPPENRNPAPEEIAACLPILNRQLELLNPAVIVVLGNVPLKTLNPAARGITAARGTPFDYRSWPVLPTFHPAYLLRNPNGMADWWVDLRQAFRMAYGEAP